MSKCEFEDRLHTTIIRRAPSVVLVRGGSKVAKGTVERILTNEKKLFHSLAIQTTTNAFCHELETGLHHGTEYGDVWAYEEVLVDLLRGGTFIVLEEIENADLTTQIFLQKLIDQLDYEALMRPQEWERGGSLVLLGSFSDVVDRMIFSMKAPLFRRFRVIVTFFPSDMEGVCAVLDKEKGDSSFEKQTSPSHSIWSHMLMTWMTYFELA